jgi:hypothetical protein
MRKVTGKIKEITALHQNNSLCQCALFNKLTPAADVNSHFESCMMLSGMTRDATTPMSATRRLSAKIAILMLAATLCFAARMSIIGATTKLDRSLDLNIYRNAGALALQGANVYDPNDKPDIRDRIRTDPLYFDPYASVGAGLWQYYVSGNLPGSTTFYGLISYLSLDDPRSWRILLAWADTLVVVAGLCWVFLFSARPVLDATVAGVFLGFYPPHLRMGTILAEDKQVQILLMLTFIVILYQKTSPLIKTVIGGLVLGQAVMFKFVGAFLILPAYRLLRRSEFIWLGVFSVFSALAVTAPYGISFVRAMWLRLYANLVYPPAHAGILAIFPEPFQTPSFKISLLAFLVSWLIWLFYRGRIDALNMASGLIVCFLCVSLGAGSIDRANMAILFCSMTVISMSRIAWRVLVLATLCSACSGYLQLWIDGTGLFEASKAYDPLEAMFILKFVVIYFLTLGIAFLLPDFQCHDKFNDGGPARSWINPDPEAGN